MLSTIFSGDIDADVGNPASLVIPMMGCVGAASLAANRQLFL